MTKEDASMNQITDYTPAALYARVSSDRQDVDLSVAAQMRALRDFARKNGYLVGPGVDNVRWIGDFRE